MITTGKFRASYAYVFQPQAPKEGGEPKYQITMLIPKSDTATYNAIVAEINQVLQNAVATTFGGQAPARPRMPIHDGDQPKENGEMWGEECRGHWVMRASSKTQPSVVDLNLQPILDPNAFYSGCYARASVNFFAYNSNGNKGIGCGLNNVQKLDDGEPLSARSTAAADFGGGNAWSGPAAYSALAPVMPGYPAPAPAVPAPTYPQQPAPAQYGQPASPAYPQQPAYPGYGAPQAALDPITGLPMAQGGVMGL